MRRESDYSEYAGERDAFGKDDKAGHIVWLQRFLFASIGIIFSIMGYAGALSNGAIAVVSVIIAAIFCFYVIHNRLLFLISIVMLYACYSVMFINYASPLTTTFFTMYRDTAEAGTALSSLLLFLSCLILFLPTQVQAFGKGDSLLSGSSCNVLFTAILLGILILILVFGFGRPDAIGSDRGSPSAIYEYSIILFLLGFYAAGNSRGWRAAFLVLLLLFAAQNIIYGGRVTALQLLLVLFFCVISYKTSSAAFTVLSIVGLLLFTVLGSLRTGLVGAGTEEVIHALGDSLSRGFTWDTAYSSWHTSITFILYGESITPAEHLFLFWQWIKSIFLGGSVPLSNLAMTTRNYFFHYYGGVLPVFFQFYLGPLGVVLIAGYVSLLIKFINSMCRRQKMLKDSIFEAAFGISALYLTVSCFRWFLYSPSQITRGLILCLLCSLLLIWLNREILTLLNRYRDRFLGAENVVTKLSYKQGMRRNRDA